MLYYWPLVFCVVVVTVVAKPPYQNEIPNGKKVPHPCDLNLVWNAVGHTDADMGGALNLNPFGKDFQGASHTWTKDLCEKDSDQDGYSNGQELGDPHCNWIAGNVPVWEPTGHPGINERIYDCSSAYIG